MAVLSQDEVWKTWSSWSTQQWTVSWNCFYLFYSI